MKISEHANYLLNEYGRLQFDYAAYCKPYGESLRNEARNNLEEYIAELEAERRWIPVSERLPEANKCVLIYDAGGNMTVDILVKSGGVETYFWLPKYRILFWMPLPNLPEANL